MRYDIALWENDDLWGLIEFDGKQHHEPVQLFGGEEQFQVQQKKDRIKDEDAPLLCKGKKCLRVGPECGAGAAQENIKKKIIDWLE